MILINPSQVEWLILNKIADTVFTTDCGEFVEVDRLGVEHLEAAQKSETYYLTPETYNQLPTEFKQLRDE